MDLGGKVVKNVAGYDVPRMLIGSWGAFAVILELTFKLYTRPPKIVGAVDPRPRRFVPDEWHRRLKQAFDPANALA